MKTPYLDKQIEELEWTELNSVATQSHKDELKEYKAIKEALSIHDVSNLISDEEIKRYRKEGRLSGATKREPFYKLISQNFDENYEDTDFDILYDC